MCDLTIYTFFFPLFPFGMEMDCTTTDCPWFRPLHELPDHLEAHEEVFEEPTGKFEFLLGSLTELVAERKAAMVISFIFSAFFMFNKYTYLLPFSHLPFTFSSFSSS